MLLTYLMLSVALCLSTVAAFYSIVGLTAIFAAAIIPVVIMGSILEIAKLVITVWLHEFWTQVKFTMKLYLIPAVAILMFITSMGIFGFLSKAHIEQVGVGQENSAQLQRIDVELKRQTEIVSKAEERAKILETTGTGADANVQSQINQEQQRIDSAYSRIQPAIDDQQRIIDGQTKIYQDQITKIDQQSALLQQYMDSKDTEKVQALVGVKTDGNWGPGTARAVTQWKEARANERAAAVAKLESANTNPTIKSAREEILRIRKTVETQISESNKLIDRLRNQLGKGDTASVETLVNEQQEKIKSANAEIESLTKKKYELEAEYRKLEVEVGPIKYIAELIYGDSTDKNMLEHAVRWVIILIVAVFDPLAVMMLLAATESMTWIRQRLPKPTLFMTETNINPDSENKDETLSETIDTNINHDLENKEKQLSEMTETVTSVQKENADLHDKINTLSEQLNNIQNERDKLFTAHSHEMTRADELEIKLSETEKNLRDQLSEVLAETLKKIEPVIDDSAEIKTDGITSEMPVINSSTNYVTYEGKSMSIDALKSLRPDLISSMSNSDVMFGIKFPTYAKIGDIYIRTDVIPHRVYKFNGQKWIIVEKNMNHSYLQSESYIKYLIDKINDGEYDADLLTDDERDEIAAHLQSK